MKYKTLEQLRDAYASGELSQDDVMIIDNDTVFVFENETKVFRSDPDTLLEDALQLLGIPSEGA